MAYLLKENNAHSTINQVGGLTLIDTTLIVSDASSFPASGDFLITIWDSDTYPDPTDDSGREIIKVTAVAGNTFTIERGQEDTIASLHANGTIVAMLITAGIFEEIEEAIASTGHEQNTDTTLQANIPLAPLLQTVGDVWFVTKYSTRYDGQTFVADKTGTLDSITIRGYRNNASLDDYDDLEMVIEEVSNGDPSGVVLDTDTVAKESIGTTEQDITFTFTGLNIVAGTSYAFYLRQKNDGGDSGSYYFTFGAQGDTEYTDGRLVWTYDGGGEWVNGGNTWSYRFSIVTSGTPGNEDVDVIVDGVLQRDLDADSNTISNLKEPADNGDALRKTATVDENSIEDAVNKAHSQNKDTILDEGGANSVTAEEIVDHIADTNNPHGVEADQVATDDSGVTVQEALDALESAELVSSLMAQDLDGDLKPIDDYLIQGGGFELNASYELQPKLTTPEDLFFEYDINDDLIPKE